MTARIVATTQPAPWLVERGVKTAEHLIIYTARVSNPSNQENTGTGERLLKYCIEHGHWSVFETASMTVEVGTSRAIAAQLLRHRSFTFQEFSQRYSDVQALGRPTVPAARMQDAKNRQSSLECEDVELADWWLAESGRVMDDAQTLYENALEKGIAKEVARFVLTLATPTRLYMTGSVRSWIHYLQTRLDVATQQEHRYVAERIAEVFADEFPVVAKAIDLESLVQKIVDHDLGKA
jgi:thymidylate synthase (FAD)